MSLWNESLLDKSEIEVLSYMAGLFKKVGICQKLNISASELLDFLIDVKNSYLDNPYHSFRHGVDVAMVLYYMMQHCHLSQYLNPYYTLILMMAGLCHDAGHVSKKQQPPNIVYLLLLNSLETTISLKSTAKQKEPKSTITCQFLKAIQFPSHSSY